MNAARPLCNCSKHMIRNVTHTRRRSLISQHDEPLKYADIVISGGGMVGMALACALKTSRKFGQASVLLLESASRHQNKEWHTLPFENRVSAITPGSKKLLKEIGAWDGILKRRLNPFNKMQIWESVGPGAITFSSEDIGESNIAYLVENSVIVESCTEKISDFDGIEMKYESRLTDILFPIRKSQEDHIIIETNDGERIETKLLIGADGPNSFVRTKAGIETYVQDYNQSAVVATLNIKTMTGVNKTAFQRYLTTGPIALLPLSPDWCSLVWSTSKSHAKHLLGMSDEEFCTSINEAFLQKSQSNTLSNGLKSAMSILQPGKHAANVFMEPPEVISILAKSRGMFPLAMAHANYYVKSRLALVGDAAHRIHPMAGQGVNLGFGDAKALVECIERSCEFGEDFGTLNQLLSYETARQRHVVSIISAINALNRLYSTELLPVVAARNLGIIMTDSVPFVKETIMKYAMQ